MELHNPFSYQESKLKWADMSINIDDPSFEITSEEETGSDFEGESNSRPIPVLQIWNPDTLETEILVSRSHPLEFINTFWYRASSKMMN